MPDKPPALVPVERGLVAALEPDTFTLDGSNTRPHAHADGEVVLGYRWAMLGLDALLYLSFGLASSSMATLAVVIAGDLHLTPAQLGAVLGSWQLAYVGCALAAGLALDRFGVRRTMSAGAVIIGLSALCALLRRRFPDPAAGRRVVRRRWTDDFGRLEQSRLRVVSELAAGTRDRRWPAALRRSVRSRSSRSATACWCRCSAAGAGALLACGSVSIVAALAWILFAREAPRHQAATSRPRQQCLDRHLDSAIAAAAQRAADPGQQRRAVHALARHRQLAAEPAGESFDDACRERLLGRDLDWHRAPDRAAAAPLRAAGEATLRRSSRWVWRVRRRSSAWQCSARLPLLLALVVFGITRAGTTPMMMLVLMDMREIGAARTGAAAGLYFTFGEIGGFGGPFLIGVLSGAGNGFVLPLLLLAGLQATIAVGALRITEVQADTSRRPT